MSSQQPKIRYVQKAESVASQAVLTPGIRPAVARKVSPARIIQPSQSEQKIQREFPVGLLVLAILVFTIGSYYLFYHQRPQAQAPMLSPTKTYSAEELKIAWYSMRPSIAAEVARLAVDEGNPNRTAELLIVNSALKGEEVVDGVDSVLIKSAFDPRWEIDLTAADRRLVLTLGLSKLLGNEAPKDLPKLSEINPGVLFALTGSAGDHLAKVLESEPAARLTALPAPLGKAFAKLQQTDQSLTCGSDIIRTFAQLKIRGGVSPQQIIALLSEKSAERLEALALLLSDDEQRAQEILHILLQHPNVRLPDERILWAEAAGLYGWKELSARAKLALLAGISQGISPSDEHLLLLFAHPNANVRACGINQALNVIRFPYPSAYNTLLAVTKAPEELNAEGTERLAELLKKAPADAAEEAKNFVATKPSAKIIAELLVGTAKLESGSGSAADFFLARYLVQSGAAKDLTAEDLKVFSLHPQAYVRLMSYQQLYQFNDAAAALTMLQSAYTKETNPQYLAQLEMIMAGVKKRLPVAPAAAPAAAPAPQPEQASAPTVPAAPAADSQPDPTSGE